jgi:hypothetical protein
MPCRNFSVHCRAAPISILPCQPQPFQGLPPRSRYSAPEQPGAYPSGSTAMPLSLGRPLSSRALAIRRPILPPPRFAVVWTVSAELQACVIGRLAAGRPGSGCRPRERIDRWAISRRRNRQGEPSRRRRIIPSPVVEVVDSADLEVSRHCRPPRLEFSPVQPPQVGASSWFTILTTSLISFGKRHLPFSPLGTAEDRQHQWEQSHDVVFQEFSIAINPEFIAGVVDECLPTTHDILVKVSDREPTSPPDRLVIGGYDLPLPKDLTYCSSVRPSQLTISRALGRSIVLRRA